MVAQGVSAKCVNMQRTTCFKAAAQRCRPCSLMQQHCVAGRHSSPFLRQRRAFQVTRAEGTAATAPRPVKPAITLTDKALEHLHKLRTESGGDELLLRIGVKSGGCSGMSYVMDFERKENVASDDAVMEYEGGFRLVCDTKSLLYLFGMNLDYSSALIGGGFQFQNPNAVDSCGCGKSFAA